MATGDIKMSSNFELNSANALDAKVNVASIAIRDAIPAIQRYDRMIVAVQAGLTYQMQVGLVDSDITNNDNWTAFGTSDAKTYKIQSNSENSFASFENEGADEFLTIQANNYEAAKFEENQTSINNLTKFKGLTSGGVGNISEWYDENDVKVAEITGQGVYTISKGANGNILKNTHSGLEVLLNGSSSYPSGTQGAMLLKNTAETPSIQLIRKNDDHRYTTSYGLNYITTNAWGGMVMSWENKDFKINQGLIYNIKLVARHGTTGIYGQPYNIYIKGGNQERALYHHTINDLTVGNVYLAGNTSAYSYKNKASVGKPDDSELLDKFEVYGGTTKTQGRRDEITSITDNYIATKSDYTIEIDASSNSVELELLEPNTDNNGQRFEIDVYDATNNITVIAYSKTLFDVDTITDQGSDTWRYTMQSSTDLSNISVGDKVKITNATNAANNGYFVTTAVDNANHYIEVTNTNGVAEASDSPCNIQETVFKDTTFVTGNFKTYRAYENRNTYKLIG